MTLLPIIDARPTESAAAVPFDDPADWHRFDSGRGSHLFVADGSRVYSLTPEIAGILDAPDVALDILDTLGIPQANAITDEPASEMPIRALSLAVAQNCNLGCTYCYAEGGSFGDRAKNMPAEVALQAVDRLLENASRGEHVNLSFLGGEPLVNREVLQLATKTAVDLARENGVSIGFSITTNGTLVTQEDADFFEQYGFAVTISLDGVGRVHDSLRSYKDGRGSYDEILQRVARLLKRQRSMQVSARVTVTPQNLCLRETLDEFVRLGFHSVGFSPLLAAPNGNGQMGNEQLTRMLDQMIDCGREFEQALAAGRRYPFTNMTNAMREIHRGTHRPYPCGAGAGYLGVSADGELAACHRFVGDSAGAMGSLESGVDSLKQQAWLRERHVHFQEPCTGCWARYLCGGGCHHEVINRGRPACAYIRGWLHYCLEAYARLLETRPDYFTGEPGHAR